MHFWPIRTALTDEPTSITVPDISCPNVTGSCWPVYSCFCPGCGGNMGPPRYSCMSDPHIPQYAILMRTSRGPHVLRKGQARGVMMRISLLNLLLFDEIKTYVLATMETKGSDHLSQGSRHCPVKQKWINSCKPLIVRCMACLWDI